VVPIHATGNVGARLLAPADGFALVGMSAGR
jgi:hypothetical protein